MATTEQLGSGVAAHAPPAVVAAPVTATAI